jgi:hypothetical protein
VGHRKVCVCAVSGSRGGGGVGGGGGVTHEDSASRNARQTHHPGDVPNAGPGRLRILRERDSNEIPSVHKAINCMGEGDRRVGGTVRDVHLITLCARPFSTCNGPPPLKTVSPPIHLPTRTSYPPPPTNDPHKDAANDAVGDAESEGLEHNDEEGGDSLLDVVPVDLDELGHLQGQAW